MSEVEARLEAAGLSLPNVPRPVANYLPSVSSGNLVFVSGQGPTRDGVPVYRGLVGEAVSEEEAYEAARLCALNSLAALKHEVGDLDLVTRLVKMLGFVASAPSFERQPFVMNGASDVFGLALAQAGRHARSAIGTNKLPFNIPVEIEIIVEVSGRS
jgi:enamine deaminase RidA (YjgF/YER057c/UK114 family)